MRHLILTVAALALSITLPAQNAESIISSLINTIESKGVRCEATIRNADEPDSQGMRASLIMKGERYSLKTPESTYWYDGRNLWNGIASGDEIIEVYITEPSDEEIVTTNPFILIKRHEGFAISVSENGTLVLKAKDQKNGSNGVLSMTVRFKSDGQPSSIDVRSRLSAQMEANFSITINRYETGNVSDSEFNYPKSKWPDAQVIDLR